MKINFKKRLQEINFYIKQIPDELPSTQNTQVIKSHIRVSIILLCSHFEGSLKDIIKTHIENLNLLNLTCIDIDNRLYAKNAIGMSINSLKDINYIIKFLDNYKIALNENKVINLKSENFNNTESNPTPELIIKLFKIFGFENIIDSLNYELLFLKPTYEQIDFLKETEREQLQKFLSEKNIIKINQILSKSRPNKKQVYKYGFYKYINDLLLARNKIVHGDSSFYLSKHDVIELKHGIFKLLCGLNGKLNENITAIQQA